MNLKFGVRKILINLTNMQLDLPRTIKERQNTKNKKKTQTNDIVNKSRLIPTN